MPKRALITGITGQDGSYLAELLLGKGYEVHGLVRRLSTPNMERLQSIAGAIHFHTGDLLDQSSLSLALDMAQPDEIYNLAGMSHVGESFKQPAAVAEYNGVGVVRLLEAIRLKEEHGGKAIRFYQASTSEMFGNAKEPVQNESTPFHPCSPYATSKVFAHQSVVNYRESYEMFACSGILFNHESPRRGIDFVTRKITDGVARIKAGLQRKITLGLLLPVRDWGFAGDYVEAMWLMLQQDKPGDYVIATGQGHSVENFVEAAFASVGIMDWQAFIDVSTEFVRPNDVSRLVGDASKAARDLGWRPRTTFEQLVGMMVENDLRRYEREVKSVASHFAGGSHCGWSVVV